MEYKIVRPVNARPQVQIGAGGYPVHEKVISLIQELESSLSTAKETILKREVFIVKAGGRLTSALKERNEAYRALLVAIDLVIYNEQHHDMMDRVSAMADIWDQGQPIQLRMEVDVITICTRQEGGLDVSDTSETGA